MCGQFFIGAGVIVSKYCTVNINFLSPTYCFYVCGLYITNLNTLYAQFRAKQDVWFYTLKPWLFIFIQRVSTMKNKNISK